MSTYQTGTPNIGEALTSIASKFSVGIVIGGIPSLAWIYLLNFLKDYKFTYVLTLGLIFATYFITTSLGGSGVLSCLVFGIMLGSYKLLNRLFKARQVEIEPLEKQLVTFQGRFHSCLRPSSLFFLD